MMINTYLRIALLIFICFSSQKIIAQKKVHAVTKHIDKRLEYKIGDELILIAEKSKINVIAWDENYINVEIELTSRHPTLETAKEELEYLEYKIESQGNHKIVKTYFLPKDDFIRVKGNLSSSYTIKVPRNCPVSVTNLYGELLVNGLKSRLDVKVRFVDVRLHRVEGRINLESYFGNIRLENSEGEFFAMLEKSNLNLRDFAGALDIKSNYGEVEIDNGNYSKFDINGARTEVTVTTAPLRSYNYRLFTYSSDIHLPAGMGTVNEKSKNVSFIKDNGDNKVWINIKTTYSSITIKPNHNVSKK